MSGAPDSLAARISPCDHSDCFYADAQIGSAVTPDDLVVSFWTDWPRWIGWLFSLRNALVKPFGLNTEKNSMEQFADAVRGGGSAGFMSVYGKSPDETVITLKDSHLTAYMSVLVEPHGRLKRIYAITVVKFHNSLGRVYFFFIAPFHNIIVRSMLKRALRKPGK